jgi:hypothetical protein
MEDEKESATVNVSFILFLLCPNTIDSINIYEYSIDYIILIRRLK